ncbi:MAG TPA: hypothetical protein VF808_05835 [Ktedonobacterales bacterium]
MVTPAVTVHGRRLREQTLRRLAVAMLALLLAQYILGMLVNFFVTIPDDHPGAHPAEYFSGAATSVAWALGHGGWELIAHAWTGILIGTLGIAMIALALMLRRRAWVVATILGFFGTLGAGFNGASFLNYGEDFSSLIMATAFLIALGSYALGLYYTKPASQTAA